MSDPSDHAFYYDGKTYSEPRTEGPVSAKKEPRERKPTFDPEYIRDISEAIYRARLEQDCRGNVDRMIEEDEDCGEKLRNRAGQYDPLTRLYLAALGFEPPPSPAAIEEQADK